MAMSSKGKDIVLRGKKVMDGMASTNPRVGETFADHRIGIHDRKELCEAAGNPNKRLDLRRIVSNLVGEKEAETSPNSAPLQRGTIRNVFRLPEKSLGGGGKGRPVIAG